MTSDDRSDAPGGPPTAAAAGEPPLTGDTLPTSEHLSRLSTDFGLGGGGPDAASADPLVGRDLGDVVVERFLASGGMGRVYAARQRSPARRVAVKVMRPSRRSPAALQRFHREAEVLGRLRHPGIAQVFLAGRCRVEGDETPYFVMEFVPEAETLVRACDRLGLGTRRRLEIFRDVCRAVAHGHAAGIVHRDLKPGNILVDGDGRPKVIDFGVARLADEAGEGFTETGEFIGTRCYSSPEQCNGGQVDARSDVYALGVVLHELLTGEMPYDVAGKSLSETARIICERPPARLRIDDRELGPSAEAIAARCLAKRANDRYPSAGDLADDVERLLAGLPTAARQPGLLGTAAVWCRRNPVLAAGGLAAALAVALAVPLVARGPRPTAAAGAGPQAVFPNISSRRTTPLQWLHVSFDEPVRSLSPADFHLTRDGVPVSLEGVRVVGGRDHWEVRGLERPTAAEGRYVFELRGTPSTPVDFAGRRLVAPARAVWQMPPYREIAFNLLDDAWKQYVVSMTDIECATERNAGAATFIRPTIPDREGSIVMTFDAPFEIRAATLTASIAVWTTGDPFPYDPRARAALDVSADGVNWTNLDTREANQGGFSGGPYDIKDVVAGSRQVWVRARLTASRDWPEDGLIHAQFLRSDQSRPQDKFRLTLTGPAPVPSAPLDGAPPADG
jgi:predicted Ser/Thr protein kinase